MSKTNAFLVLSFLSFLSCVPLLHARPLHGSSSFEQGVNQLAESGSSFAVLRPDQGSAFGKKFDHLLLLTSTRDGLTLENIKKISKKGRPAAESWVASLGVYLGTFLVDTLPGVKLTPQVIRHLSKGIYVVSDLYFGQYRDLDASEHFGLGMVFLGGRYRNRTASRETAKMIRQEIQSSLALDPALIEFMAVVPEKQFSKTLQNLTELGYLDAHVIRY